MSKPERKKKYSYIKFNVPIDWEPFLKEALENPEVQKELELGRYSKTYGGLGNLIIHRFLVDKTSFRLQHFKTYNDRAVIVDNKLGRLIDIHLRPDGKFWCEYCDSTDCEHAKFAHTVPEITKLLKERE